ncbi:MAG: acyl-CoA dehydrogenase C-terminal domain-containing protein [Gammaproteobacteria bacterium]|nr:acyl-CoA dehydrogenase C-terminal domain-containing protein [Gammaproteobacteria bacterium]
MASYKAPIDDLRFVTRELLADQGQAGLPGSDEFTPDLVDAILEGAGKFCETVLFPLNRSGDEEGCTYENGVVRTPAGFKDAYEAYAAGGWNGLHADPEFGGQDAPNTVYTAVQEMICSSNLSFGMYPGLTQGAYHAIHAHGTEEQKRAYLPHLVDGSWSGTMCLTEPHCGTDLGLLRTRAEPQPDGSYRISGTKIFISAGEHDLTENIVHLVLARTPDAPEGTRGISMFVVPKFLPNGDGVGPANGVRCGGIEQKMGIKASATCVLNFDDARGFLIGEKNKGMRAMFTMMNAARLAVGVQGLGIAESAYQGAVAYARERLQGRALGGPRFPDRPADPILVHPDVRRMLLTMRANSEGARALVAWVSAKLDVAQRHPDPDVAEAADEFVSLLTPVVKAFLTDLGSETANLGVQIFGGHGYIREHGMEQYVRDARICQIYEGTNGVQAMDLVGRKLSARTGRYLRRFFHPIAEYIAANKDDETLERYVTPLSRAFGRLQRATVTVAARGLGDPDEAGAAAMDYLRLFGLVAFAYLWTRAAEVSIARLGNGNDGFYRAKIDTADFFMDRILPQSGALFAGIMAGASSTMSFNDDAF